MGQAGFQGWLDRQSIAAKRAQPIDGPEYRAGAARGTRRANACPPDVAQGGMRRTDGHPESLQGVDGRRPDPRIACPSQCAPAALPFTLRVSVTAIADSTRTTPITANVSLKPIP